MGHIFAMCPLLDSHADRQPIEFGRVLDPRGEPLVNIEVTLVNQLTGAERIEATGDSGDFAFASEQPGTFSILVKAPGVKVLTKKDLVLTASERLSAGNLQLQIGAIEETVTVQAETTPVQTTSSERSALLDRTRLETLMTQGRDFLSLAKILPGVVGGGGASQLGVLTSPTVNGVRSEYNQLSIDGVIGNTRGLANLDTPLNMDAISEVKILQNNYQAEYGGSSGSMINAVTKAGARDFHGSAYYYKRHEQFNASNFFNSAYWASADR